MRFLCARLYNAIEQKHPALHFYLGTSVTSCPGSGRRASIPLHAAHVLWSPVSLRDSAASGSISSTKQQWPQLFLFLGSISSQELRPGQLHTQGWGAASFLIPTSSTVTRPASPRGPTALLTAVSRGRSIRGSPNHSSSIKIHRLWGFFFHRSFCRTAEEGFASWCIQKPSPHCQNCRLGPN